VGTAVPSRDKVIKLSMGGQHEVWSTRGGRQEKENQGKDQKNGDSLSTDGLKRPEVSATQSFGGKSSDYLYVG